MKKAARKKPRRLQRGRARTSPPKVSTVLSPAAEAVDSEGRRMLLEVPGSLVELAAQVGSARQTVANWRRGSKVPDAPYRSRIHAAWGISPSAWDVAPHTAPPATNGTRAAPASSNGGATPSTLEECLEVLATLRDLRRQDGLLPDAKIKLSQATAQHLALRHRLEREQELLEDRLVHEHPAWQRWKRRVLEALVAYPDAALAVESAFLAAVGQPPTPPPQST